jgi:hypothetical protein
MERGSHADAPSIIADIRASMDRAVDRLTDGYAADHGLLDRGLRVFLG